MTKEKLIELINQGDIKLEELRSNDVYVLTVDTRYCCLKDLQILLELFQHSTETPIIVTYKDELELKAMNVEYLKEYRDSINNIIEDIEKGKEN